MEKATLANGCFWCTEAIFKRVKGISHIQSGYSGGTVENPSYDQVCMGTTGHAEAIQFDYDPNVISFDKILDIFFALHDPTTKNQQGNDIGPQYRSAIFYHSVSQKDIAENKIKELISEKKFNDPIVTEVTAFTNFYPAEPHHQNYYDRNTDYPYCKYIIDPKVQKLLKEFKNEVIEENP